MKFKSNIISYYFYLVFAFCSFAQQLYAIDNNCFYLDVIQRVVLANETKHKTMQIAYWLSQDLELTQEQKAKYWREFTLEMQKVNPKFVADEHRRPDGSIIFYGHASEVLVIYPDGQMAFTGGLGKDVANVSIAPENTTNLSFLYQYQHRITVDQYLGGQKNVGHFDLYKRHAKNYDDLINKVILAVNQKGKTDQFLVWMAQDKVLNAEGKAKYLELFFTMFGVRNPNYRHKQYRGAKGEWIFWGELGRGILIDQNAEVFAISFAKESSPDDKGEIFPKLEQWKDDGRERISLSKLCAKEPYLLFEDFIKGSRNKSVSELRN